MARGRNGICQNIIETVYRGTDTRRVSTAKFGCVNRICSPPGNKKEPTSCVFRFACIPKRSLLLSCSSVPKREPFKMLWETNNGVLLSLSKAGECLRKPPKRERVDYRLLLSPPPPPPPRHAWAERDRGEGAAGFDNFSHFPPQKYTF